MTENFQLSSPDLSATISPIGAQLKVLQFRSGANLVLHSDEPAFRNTYGGAIVGPVANRVANGRCVIAGKTYQMPCNENNTTALHSGPDGLDNRLWQIVGHSAQALHLSCTLADGDGGLPGNRQIDATYSVDGACLSLVLHATTDATTPISLAHHPYWRLGDPSEHMLQIEAQSYLPINDKSLPTGEVLDVTDTVYDHRNFRATAPQTDHNFCLQTTRSSVPKHAAKLRGSGGVTLCIETTEPGLQVYSGAFLPDLPNSIIEPFAGIALEPQGWPDAVNQPTFPSVIVTPDTPYHQITNYILTTTV